MARGAVPTRQSEQLHGGDSGFWHSVPLLAFGLALYALINAFASDPVQPWYLTELFRIHQLSGDTWRINVSDAFLALSIALLFAELIRATRTTAPSLVNHALSALVFIGAMLLFVTRQGYGNSTFFLFTSLTLVDFVAGFIITTVAARRDVTISH